MASELTCIRCGDNLDDDSIDYYRIKHDWLLEIGSGPLCQNHWCECMPDSTPWKYLTGCVICNKSICKSCKTETKGGGLICTVCRELLGDRW